MNKYIEEILMYESTNKNKPFDLALIPEDVREYVIWMLRKEYIKKIYERERKEYMKKIYKRDDTNDDS